MPLSHDRHGATTRQDVELPHRTGAVVISSVGPKSNESFLAAQATLIG